MKLSPSSLSVFKECQRCFWHEHVGFNGQKTKRPRGIFPSLPGGMDRALKRYADENWKDRGIYHLDGLKGAVLYPDRVAMKVWQNNFKGLSDIVSTPHGDVHLRGAIDDLVQWPDGRVSPFDFKTRGAAPKEGASELYYGSQLDIYHYLLEKDAGLKCTGKGYLRYGWPGNVMAKTVDFEWATVPLDTDPDRAVKLVEDAAKCLASKTEPDFNIECEYCVFILDRTPR